MSKCDTLAASSLPELQEDPAGLGMSERSYPIAAFLAGGVAPLLRRLSLHRGLH